MKHAFEPWRALTEAERVSLGGFFDQHAISSVRTDWVKVQEQGDFTLISINLMGAIHIGVSKRSGNDRPRRSKGVVEAFKRAWLAPPVKV